MHGLMLAPMAGFTDYSFRKICRESGAEYTVSEMVSAKALCYEQLSKKIDPTTSKTAPLASVRREENPMAIQLFGSEPEFVAQAAEMIEDMSYRSCVSEVAPVAIDINMGCPMHKIVGNGEGSALMRDPEHAARFIEEFSDRVLYGCDICNPSNRHQYQFNDFLNKMLADKMISEENYYKLVRGNAVKLLKLEEN